MDLVLGGTRLKMGTDGSRRWGAPGRHNAKADYGIESSNSISSSARTATVGSELKICHRLTDIGPGFAV